MSHFIRTLQALMGEWPAFLPSPFSAGLSGLSGVRRFTCWVEIDAKLPYRRGILGKEG
jgi:hypothetical protein